MAPAPSHSPLVARLSAPGPKRLLAIDGAGARSAISLPMLAAIEEALGRPAGDPKFRLSDYFHLIGGTGTGAVIAAMLARGMLGDVHTLRPVPISEGLSQAAQTLLTRLALPGPKRILSIDSGGMRCTLAPPISGPHRSAPPRAIWPAGSSAHRLL